MGCNVLRRLRCRFGSCMHRRRRDASMAEQGEALLAAWLFIVLQWLVTRGSRANELWREKSHHGPASRRGEATAVHPVRVNSMIQFVSHVLPSSGENACSHRVEPRGATTCSVSGTAAPASARRAAQSRPARPRSRSGGVGYLVAQSGNLIRTIRAANISDAVLGDESFARPKNFRSRDLLGEDRARL